MAGSARRLTFLAGPLAAAAYGGSNPGQHHAFAKTTFAGNERAFAQGKSVLKPLDFLGF